MAISEKNFEIFLFFFIFVYKFNEMDQIILKNGEIVLISPEDYEMLSNYKWNISKGRNTNYAVATINKKTVMMHRLINNTPSHLVTDHINRNGLDNRRENLRSVTKSENGRNRDRNQDKRLLKRVGKKHFLLYYKNSETGKLNTI